MKCPACGFETPDSQTWCDFCKEPFRKPTPKAAPADPPPAAPPEPSPSPRPAEVPVDPAAVKDMSGEKLLELLKMDASKDSIPTTSPSTRYLAWSFLAAVFLMMMVFCFLLLRKAQRGEVPGPRHGAQEPPIEAAPGEPPAAAPSETSPGAPKQTL